jgi:RNA polymerase sigma factor (sigma-70 family)
MEDSEVVAAIVAGDPAGLAEAYDRYAVPLYSYCRSMLREPADAADAVQDTFLVATAKLRGLRDPGKLRSWLYAVARNECLRLRRARSALFALEDAADVPTETAEIGAAPEQADLRDLVRAAIDGLNPGEREIIELSLGHELDRDELASALGVSRNHAHALLSRARGQLERSLGALIVARTGRAACTDLDAMLAGWDGQLTVLMRKRISRHIEQCEVCGERKRRELSSALFASVMPLAALWPGFREHLLRVLADRTPAGLAHRLGVANRAGPFGPTGFPKPVHPPGTLPWHRAVHHSKAAVAGAATSVMAAGAIAAVVISGPQHGPLAAGVAGGATHGASGLPSSSSAHGGPSARGGNGLAPPAPTRSGTTAPDAFFSSPGTPSSAASSGSSPSVPGSSSSAPGSSSSAPGSSSSAPGPSSSPPSVSAGTLSVSTGRVVLVSVNGTATGTFTLTAKGGPVSSYSITVGPALAGRLTVSPSAGSLASGASVTITVTSTSLVTLHGTLTVNPGGQTITVVLSLGV